MKLSRVEASSMHEALLKIKATLGDDAQIVGTRTFRRGGVLGVGGRECVEVYVADASAENREKEVFEQRKRKLAEMARNRVAEGDVSRSKHVEELAKMVGTLRTEIQDIASGQQGKGLDHPFLRNAQELLAKYDVDPDLVEKILWELHEKRLPVEVGDPQRVKAVMRAQLRNLFLPNVATGLPQTTKVMMLIGPTGVGKTTTIAKLAARAKINERKRVGLITLDTFRIAAVDQLNKYANIIGVPLAVVSDPVQLRGSVDELLRNGADLVLVDTAGRGQRDDLKMSELQEFLSTVPNTEIHLVMSTTTHPRTMRNVVKRFAPFGYHRIILTKLDETESFGSLVSVIADAGKPVSFITDGQNVPEDIMPSDPDRLSDLVFRASEN